MKTAFRTRAISVVAISLIVLSVIGAVPQLTRPTTNSRLPNIPSHSQSFSGVPDQAMPSAPAVNSARGSPRYALTTSAVLKPLIHPHGITFTTSTALTSDVYCSDMTISPGVTLTTNGHSIYCSGTLTNQGVLVTGQTSFQNFFSSYGGSGGGGASSSCSAGSGSGYSTIVPGGQGSNNDNGGNGGTPILPSLSNSQIQNWYTGGMTNFLLGAGGQSTCQETGGAGSFGVYVQANQIIAGTVSASGQQGTGMGSGVGLSGGGGGGVVVLYYGSGGYASGSYSVGGGSGVSSSNGQVHSGNGGNGQVQAVGYGATPPIGIAPTVTLYSPSVNGLSVTLNGVTSPPQNPSGSSISQVQWQWGDGQTTFGFFPQTHTYSTGGSYNVIVTSYASDGPTASTSTSVTLTQTSTVTFSATGIDSSASNSGGLYVDSVQYLVKQLPLSFSWTSGSSHSFTWIVTINPGAQIESVWQTTSGCGQSYYTGSINVPSTNCIVSATYSPLDQVTFIVSSSNDGTISWSGGGNTPGSTTNSGNSWYYPGTTISISGAPSSGFLFQSWSASSSVSVSSSSSASTSALISGPGAITGNFLVACGAPTVSVSAPTVSGLSVSVNGFTQPGGPSCSISSVSWTWGDGMSSLSFFPATHTYTTGGTYSITTTTHQSDGQTASTTTTVAFAAAVTFSGVGLSSYSGRVLVVDGSTYNASQLPLSFTWVTGSSHQFSWIVTVTANSNTEYVWQNGSGCGQSSYSGTITVPAAGCTVSATYSPLFQVTFAVNPSGDGNVSWTGGGNVPGSTTTSGSSWYYAGSSLSINAAAVSGYKFSSWSNSSSVTISSPFVASTTATIDGPGTVTASFGVQCSSPTISVGTPSVTGLNVSVNGLTQPGSSSCSISSISWIWGDGATSVSFFPATHTYVTTGTFSITVTSHQSDGQTTTTSTSVAVPANCAPSISLQSPSKNGLTVAINGVARPCGPGTGITSIFWTWGDGSTSVSFFPASHTYSAFSSYTITAAAQQSDTRSASASTLVILTQTSALVTFSAAGLSSSASSSLLIVDGVTYSVSQVPTSLSWIVSSSHSFNWYVTVTGSSNTEYVWQTSSGCGQSSYSGTITVPSSNCTVNATYSPLYQVTFVVNPPNDGTLNWNGGGNTPGSTSSSGVSWYYPGTSISISSNVASGYSLKSWSSTSSISISSFSSATTSALISGPGTITAVIESNNILHVSSPTASPMYIIQGQTSTLSALVAGGTSPYNCQWFEMTPGASTYSSIAGASNCSSYAFSTSSSSTIGGYEFELQATDSESPSATVTSAPVAVTVETLNPLTITTSLSLGPCPAAGPCFVFFQASGGSGTYSWSVPGPIPALFWLPSGLTLYQNGTLKGIVQVQTGTYSFPVQVSDTLGQQVSQTFSLKITNGLPAEVSMISYDESGIGKGPFAVSVSVVDAEGDAVPSSPLQFTVGSHISTSDNLQSIQTNSNGGYSITVNALAGYTECGTGLTACSSADLVEVQAAVGIASISDYIDLPVHVGPCETSPFTSSTITPNCINQNARVSASSTEQLSQDLTNPCVSPFTDSTISSRALCQYGGTGDISLSLACQVEQIVEAVACSAVLLITGGCFLGVVALCPAAAGFVVGGLAVGCMITLGLDVAQAVLHQQIPLLVPSDNLRDAGIQLVDAFCSFYTTGQASSTQTTVSTPDGSGQIVFPASVITTGTIPISVNEVNPSASSISLPAGSKFYGTALEVKIGADQSISSSATLMLGYDQTAIPQGYTLAVYQDGVQVRLPTALQNGTAQVSMNATGYYVVLAVPIAYLSISCASQSVEVGQSVACTATLERFTGSVAGDNVSWSVTSSGGAVLSPSNCQLLSNQCSINVTSTTLNSVALLAKFGGDANNLAHNATFGIAVRQASPAITSLASPSTIVVGNSDIDLAIITNGFNLSGNVTYSLYSDQACTVGIFNSRVALGSQSAPFVPRVWGLYEWIVSYSGDVNNSPVGTSCGSDPLRVTDFNVTASSLSLSVPQGSNSTSTITLTSLGGFSGNVTLTSLTSNLATLAGGMGGGHSLEMLPMPCGINANLSLSMVTLIQNGTAIAVLTISAPSCASPGVYSIMVNAFQTGLLRSVQLMVTVPASNPIGPSVSPQPSSAVGSSSLFESPTLSTIKAVLGLLTILVLVILGLFALTTLCVTPAERSRSYRRRRVALGFMYQTSVSDPSSDHVLAILLRR